MTKKLSRREAARLLKFIPMTVQRLALVATQGVKPAPEYWQWVNGEYTEQDNILFRLFVELKNLLPDGSTAMLVVSALWDQIDDLVAASQRTKGEPPGVVVIADNRFVRWPGRESWFDCWAPDQPRFSEDIEPSLRITTAIHLQAMLQPLQEVE